MKSALIVGLSLLTLAAAAAQSPELPHLRKQGTATQLVVDSKPFLIRGGELGNSSASNVDYLAPQRHQPHLVLTSLRDQAIDQREVEAPFGRLDQIPIHGRQNRIQMQPETSSNGRLPTVQILAPVPPPRPAARRRRPAGW
jgi:hypothetical protein